MKYIYIFRLIFAHAVRSNITVTTSFLSRVSRLPSRTKYKLRLATTRRLLLGPSRLSPRGRLARAIIIYVQVIKTRLLRRGRRARVNNTIMIMRYVYQLR